MEHLFQEKDISYSLRYEGLKKKSFPVFKMVIKDPPSLTFVLEETFWMAASNQFFALSFSDNVTYQLAVRKGLFRNKKPYMLPSFQMRDASTVIKIWHDERGFNLYTNDRRYSIIKMLTNHLPKGTIVENH
ncbi:hypothetical protein M3221_16925 [Domibacillus indicus]|uniref:hypothetical protein n=1 Tax=Domibacillus indicus TaxID=1437523 RepID=UPI002040D16B|nr:hypothetical protein [Domibacillus indicus]MCM3790073.1 hypothetical protein [Domibacillus indicus]